MFGVNGNGRRRVNLPVLMPHAYRAWSGKKPLGISLEAIGAPLRTKMVNLAVVFDSPGGLSWIDRHPANRVFGIGRPGQDGQTCAGRLRVRR